MAPELLGVIVGAGAAIVTQSIAATLQYVQKQQEMDLKKKELMRDARRNFEERRLTAMIDTHETLAKLLDGDIKASEAYSTVRANWFFLTDETESLVRSAIREAVRNKTPKDEVGELFRKAFRALEAENDQNMRQHYE